MQQLCCNNPGSRFFVLYEQSLWLAQNDYWLAGDITLGPQILATEIGYCTLIWKWNIWGSLLNRIEKSTHWLCSCKSQKSKMKRLVEISCRSPTIILKQDTSCYVMFRTSSYVIFRFIYVSEYDIIASIFVNWD